MRINKYFSNLGICSRRETNRLIEEKREKLLEDRIQLQKQLKKETQIK